MGKLTDNKLYQIKVKDLDVNDVNLHSTLVDLGLNKFEAAKIEEIEFYAGDVAKRISDTSAGGSIFICVLNDPDDEATLDYPDNERNHDVIAAYRMDYEWIQNVANVWTESETHIDFDEDEDVYCLRNIRVNHQCETTAIGTDAFVIIKFRIEEVQKSDYVHIIESLAP